MMAKWLRCSACYTWIFSLVAVGAVNLAVHGSLTGHRQVTVCDQVALPTVQRIIQQRCSRCHCTSGGDRDSYSPPAGIAFDTTTQILAQASQIESSTFKSRSMPPGNITGMTDDERAYLSRWSATIGAGDMATCR